MSDIKSVPALPKLAEPGTPMFLYLNTSLAQINLGKDNPLVKQFKYVLAWIKRTGVQMDIYHMILVKEIPNEIEFFKFCAELLVNEDFAVPQEEFMTWVAWIAEIEGA